MDSLASESPTVHEQHSDAFVQTSALPREDTMRDFGDLPLDERAWAASFFGWNRDPTEEEMDEEYQRCLRDEERRNEDELLSRYPGLANVDTETLREIVGNPLTGLMEDADEAVAAASILLRRRQQETAAA